MLTEFKFWWVKRDDDGFITEAAVYFTEGDIQTVTKEHPITGEMVTKDVYVRSGHMKKNALKHLSAKKNETHHGIDFFYYHPDEFGRIKTDEELIHFLKGELKKDKGHDPVDAQL